MATMKTLNGYGFNATELNGKTASDYLLKTDTAADSAKLGGKAPEYYLSPRNLLDNSDFRNPVNQRGQTSYSGMWVYSIDRWVAWLDASNSATVSVINGGITPYPGMVIQRIESKYIDSSKTYTLAAMTGDGLLVLSGKITSTTQSATNANNGIYFNYNADVDVYQFKLAGLTSASKFVWAALYEGSYTADTLPPYVPKGYAVELAECLRYFERLGSTYSERIGNTVYVVSGAKSFVCSLQCSRKRILHPSVSISGVDNYRLLLKDATNASTYSAASISSFDDITIQEPFISFRVNMVSAITQNSWIALQRSDNATAAYIDISADL